MLGRVRRAEVALSAGLLTLSAGFAWLVWRLPDAPGYSQVGPKVVPAMAAIGLLVASCVLLFEAMAGGFRGRVVEDTDPFDAKGFAWLAAGLALQMVLIQYTGFVAASTLLFLLTARGLGSRRWARDLLIGAVLASVLYGLFTGVLGLSLGPSFGNPFRSSA